MNVKMIRACDPDRFVNGVIDPIMGSRQIIERTNCASEFSREALLIFAILRNSWKVNVIRHTAPKITGLIFDAISISHLIRISIVAVITAA